MVTYTDLLKPKGHRYFNRPTEYKYHSIIFIPQNVLLLRMDKLFILAKPNSALKKERKLHVVERQDPGGEKDHI